MKSIKLIRRKECYTLTFRGWLLLLLFFLILFFLVFNNIHQFLAANKPIDADAIIIEGWLPDYALEKVLEEFNSHDYQLLVITGGPILKGSYLIEYKTQAELAAKIVLEIGFDESKLVVIPSKYSEKDRTYECALTVKEWLKKSGQQIKSINVISLGPHSRRSWILYEKALENQVDVGIVALKQIGYEPKKWWRTSQGVRVVIDEAIGYIYARFFFHPSKE